MISLGENNTKFLFLTKVLRYGHRSRFDSLSALQDLTKLTIAFRAHGNVRRIVHQSGCSVLTVPTLQGPPLVYLYIHPLIFSHGLVFLAELSHDSRPFKSHNILWQTCILFSNEGTLLFEFRISVVNVSSVSLPRKSRRGQESTLMEPKPKAYADTLCCFPSFPWAILYQFAVLSSFSSCTLKKCTGPIIELKQIWNKLRGICKALRCEGNSVHIIALLGMARRIPNSCQELRCTVRSKISLDNLLLVQQRKQFPNTSSLWLFLELVS